MTEQTGILESVEGCTHDGISAREHGQRYAPGTGWHVNEPPDPRLLHQRMRERRDERATVRYLAAKADGFSDYEAREEGWPTSPDR